VNACLPVHDLGRVSSFAEARQIIDRSFPLESLELCDSNRRNLDFVRFHRYLEQN